MLILPHLKIFKLEKLCLELSGQMADLVEARRPKQVVFVDSVRVNARLLMDESV